ncbi:MAG: carboxymuconolactone decarboxylase family protein [Clostridiales bacterium]|nr:carboxymuconolactone decarboxylase family protein [Clostridiales bacterium]
MKRLFVTFLTTAVLFCNSVNTFAVSDELFSTDTDEISAALSELTDEERQEYIDENLTVTEQQLSMFAILTANQSYDKITEQVKSAVDAGVEPVEIKEAIYHAAPYCGFTRAIAAAEAADKAFTELEIEIPVESQATVTDETRYDDGLAVQRELFGPQIGTITDDMTDSSKLQTIYLSGICFGDFYTRTGLELSTREFLTFCTISGNGTCSGQLGSHTNGNLNIGHSKDMLRAAIILNEEYNGEEKTVEALRVVNSTGE